MSCERMDLSAYVDGELAGEVRAAVEAHLSGCAACSADVADLSALAAAMTAEAAPPPSSAAVEAAVRMARAAVVRERASVWRTLARLWSVRVSVPAPVFAAAVVLLILAIGRFDRAVALRPAYARRDTIVHEQWNDRRLLWEEPAVTASYEKDDANFHVVYDESVSL